MTTSFSGFYEYIIHNLQDYTVLVTFHTVGLVLTYTALEKNKRPLLPLLIISTFMAAILVQSAKFQPKHTLGVA